MPSALEPPRLISMEVTRNGSADSHYRILANRKVKYITIKAGALDAASLDDMDLDFQNVLPPLPYQEDTWKLACITRNPFSGRLEAALSSAALPSVKTIWHPQMIDHLDIERTEYLALLTQECKWKADSGPERMIAKMARFYWEVQYMEAETRMYQVLEGRGIAPKFLGHVHEAGRVIGFLLEKIPDGRHAEPADLEICKVALRRFHGLGFVHGDCNKYNFIIRPNGQVVLIDFDKANTCTDPALMEAEIASLEEQLVETTGRGGGLMAFDEGNGIAAK
ncbi:alpha-galactosidase A [Apiosordaria backusii]|uniref:Alpha-galactosidase A n=1 Tax=Apiosordaria backusii TaxID=314023 RepID=A0AA40AAJ0_9PEZI|nr:alpha-galactosidase A [Apiosordaria backusii]